MPRYFRKPGQKVIYTPQQTARYVSRLARSQRGMHISPISQKAISNGYEFKFFSPRGPASTQGHWIVTATEKDSGGGDGGGDGSHESGEGPVPGGQCVGTKYGVKFRYTYTFRGYEHIYTSIWYIGYGPIGRLTWWIHEPTDRLFINWPWFDDQGNPKTASYSRGNFWYGFDTTPYYLDIQAIDGPNNCGSLPPVGGSGGGGGGGNGRCKYSYTCTCPDYTKTQPKLFAPVYPSDFKDRSWTASNAGALPGPPKFCKHIIAVVNLLNDGEFLSGVNISNDIPHEGHPRTLPQNFEEFLESLEKKNPDYYDPTNFWKDVDQFLDKLKRKERLDYNLDWISRMRAREITREREYLGPQQDIYTGPGPDGARRYYQPDQVWYTDHTGKDMTYEQYVKYFRDTMTYHL